MYVELLVEWELAGKTEVLGENLPQCHFVHHKSNITYSRIKLGRRGEKPTINHVSYSTARDKFHIHTKPVVEIYVFLCSFFFFSKIMLVLIRMLAFISRTDTRNAPIDVRLSSFVKFVGTNQLFGCMRTGLYRLKKIPVSCMFLLPSFLSTRFLSWISYGLKFQRGRWTVKHEDGRLWNKEVVVF
jgi:hypothetical protein